MTEDRLDAAFAALADPTRRAIVSRLAQGDATVNELAAPFTMSLPGISKHLKVLERSGLISRRRDAQFRPCHLEVDALDGALDWIDEHRRDLGGALRQARRASARPPGEPRVGRRAGTNKEGTEHERTHRSRRAALHTHLRRAARARLRLHDRPRPPHPLLGPDRRQRTARPHRRSTPGQAACSRQ